jgi:endonuclease/exonuclease/phosphatase family metal-dependent hydrolase
MEDKSEMEKDQFYEQLERTYTQCPSYDIKIIIGDFNAKVGNESWARTAVGGHSLHDEINGNRVRLINFAVHQQMMIGEMLFPHNSIHKGTWRSPDGRTVNQIDHVLIDQRHRTNLFDVRRFRGANADTNHYLFIAGLRDQITRPTDKRTIKAGNKYDKREAKKNRSQTGICQ